MIPDPTYKPNAKNPLTDLSELRLQIENIEDRLSLRCQLKFGVMRLDHDGFHFEVGLSRAVLRLALEGCETKMGSNFAERHLEAVTETETSKSSSSWGVNVEAGFSELSNPKLELRGHGAIGSEWERIQSKNGFRHAVRALPNDGWEVSAQTIGTKSNTMIEGTALSGDVLCELQQLSGGNRLSVVGELQASKRTINVVAKGGNVVGRNLLRRENRDAVLGIIVGKALEREAVQVGVGQHDTHLVASRCEVGEE